MDYPLARYNLNLFVFICHSFRQQESSCVHARLVYIRLRCRTFATLYLCICTHFPRYFYVFIFSLGFQTQLMFLFKFVSFLS